MYFVREQGRKTTTPPLMFPYSVAVVRDELEQVEGLVGRVHLQVHVPRAASVTVHDVTPAIFVFCPSHFVLICFVSAS